MENAWEWLVVSINFLKRTRILENDLKNRLFRWATMRQTEKESYRLKTQELAGFKEGLINTILMQGGTPPMCVPAGASAHNSSWDLERGFQRRRGKKKETNPQACQDDKKLCLCTRADICMHIFWQANEWMYCLKLLYQKHGENCKKKNNFLTKFIFMFYSSSGPHSFCLASAPSETGSPESGSSQLYWKFCANA